MMVVVVEKQSLRWKKSVMEYKQKKRGEERDCKKSP
jgi:hypothetical protein